LLFLNAIHPGGSAFSATAKAPGSGIVSTHIRLK
jgi:hypothetical protein